MQRRFPASWLLALAVLASSAFGQIVPFTWTINGPDNLYASAANWQDGTAPQVADPTAQIRLLPGEDAIVLPAGNVTLNSLRFQGGAQVYRYTFESGGATTLTLLDGVTVDSGPSTHLQFDEAVTVNLGADQTWRANYVTVDGAIGGPGHLTFLPAGYFFSSYHDGSITLNGPGNFSGGFRAYDAWVYLGHPQALAGGPLDFGNVDLSNTTGSDIVFDHPVTLSSVVRFVQWNHPDTTFIFDDAAVLAGGVGLANYGARPVYFKDTIAESEDGSASLSLDGFFVFEGDNSEGAYTGGTYVNSGAAIYAHGSSVPTEGLISASLQGYVGAAFTTNVQAKLVDRLDPEQFTGTLGFDSDPLGPVQTFAEPLDLSSLTDLRGLGSTTRAVLSGGLTLGSGQDYRFGGGGGVLIVTSDLTQTTAKVVLDVPPDTPALTVVLQGNNAFTGGVEVSRGILVFDGATALPAGNTITLDGTPAYAGATENVADTPAQFLARFSSLPGTGIVGFDSADPHSLRTIATAIDLSLGGARTTPYYLGTSTALTLTGTITAPGSTLRLAGVNGGRLFVDSNLTGPIGVTLGLTQPLGRIPGFVALGGANTYSGGTTLLSGVLHLGGPNALGTGPLVVGGDYSTLRVLTNENAFTLANSIHLGQSLTVGQYDTTANLTLTGPISGQGTLDHEGANTLTFSGAAAGSIRNLEVDSATGGSVVIVGNTRGLIADLRRGDLSFTSPHPHVRSLDSLEGTTLHLGPGTSLLFHSDGLGEGSIDNLLEGTLSGPGRIVLEYGDGLRLHAANNFTGGIELRHGLLSAGDESAFGSGTVTVRGPFDDPYYLYSFSSERRLSTSAPGLDLANPIDLQGSLMLGGDYYLSYYAALDQVPDFTLSGPIAGPGSLGKTEENTVVLSGNNTFTGNLYLINGTLEFGSNTAAGQGLLIFPYNSDHPTARFTTGSPVIGGLYSEDSGATIELAANSTLTIQQNENTTFDGQITGAGARLAKDGIGTLRLVGANSYTGGTQVNEGEIVFGTTASLLNTTGTGSNRITVASGGYAGIGSINFGTAAFLSLFDPAATTGSIGFDSASPYEPNTYTGAVNLAGFNSSVRLGSATAAVLSSTAVITPQGSASDPYRFGGGGGTLFVQSALGGSRAVTVNSPSTAPLTLAVLGESAYAGGTEATHSAVVFGPGALPPSGDFTLGPGGYIGSADPALAPTDFIARFAADTDQGMIGFDILDPNDQRILATPVDLSAFHSGAYGVYLGTTTRLELRGPLTPATSSLNPIHRFGAFKGGELVVRSSLTGSDVSVHIGDPHVLASFGDPSFGGDLISTVVLDGANSYGATTTLYTGRLLVGGQGVTNALGTGALIVQPHSLTYPDATDLFPELGVVRSGTVIPNGLDLNGGLDLGGNASFTLAGLVEGSGPLVKFGETVVRLSGNNTYSGGTIVEEGRLEAGHDHAFGTGPLIVRSDGELAAAGGPRTLANNVVVEGNNLRTGGGHDLTFTGPVQLQAGFTQLTASSENPRLNVFFDGPLSGDSVLYSNYYGTYWLNGANTYGGGTSGSGRIIFGSTDAIPDSGPLAANFASGYIGLATPTAQLQADYLGRFRIGGESTIGFDTSPGEAVSHFTAPIDLTVLGAAYRLGSATRALISGAITPAGDSYRFGGGGGRLTVSSALVDGGTSRDLEIMSGGDRPLLLRLSGTNTYTGDTIVYDSALVFETAASIPASGILHMNSGGYIGTMDPAVTFPAFLNRFNSSLPSGTLGFDSANPQSPRTLTSPDLSGFVTSWPEIGLGTATAAVIDGTITLPSGQTVYRFNAVHDGRLTVNAALSGNRSVVINQRDFSALGSYEPTVVLGGNNNHTGDTFLFGGRLVIAHASALGTGDLIVQTDSGNERSTLELTVPSLASDINVSGPLTFAGSSAATLSGILSGYADLIKQDAFTLTLSGANTFNYGVLSIRGGTVAFAHNAAAGAGQVQLVFEQGGGTASFSTPSPVIGGLASVPGVPAAVMLSDGTTLKVNSDYDVTYAGVINGEGGLDKDGYGTLRLAGASDYEGGTTITSGSLIAAHAGALGLGGVTLDGGALVVAPGISLGNAIGFGAGGGTLGGNGTFGGAVSLGSGAVLSPGNSIGTLHFASNLTWGQGAFLDFELQDAFGAPGFGYDTVVVAGTLAITSNFSSPFTLNLISLDGSGTPGGVPGGFDARLGYSWLVASAAEIDGFNASHFLINETSFGAALHGGSFNLSVTGSDLFLNFTPVPEPSTYVLMIAGLGLMAIVCRRRTRN